MCQLEGWSKYIALDKLESKAMRSPSMLISQSYSVHLDTVFTEINILCTSDSSHPLSKNHADDPNPAPRHDVHASSLVAWRVRDLSLGACVTTLCDIWKNGGQQLR